MRRYRRRRRQRESLHAQVERRLVEIARTHLGDDEAPAREFLTGSVKWLLRDDEVRILESIAQSGESIIGVVIDREDISTANYAARRIDLPGNYFHRNVENARIRHPCCFDGEVLRERPASVVVRRPLRIV